jgi:hypothetical protein
MKKSRFFTVAGAIVLAISAVFAEKQSRKFRDVSTACGYFNSMVIWKEGNTIFTSSDTGIELYATLCTWNGTPYGEQIPLFTATNYKEHVYGK